MGKKTKKAQAGKPKKLVPKDIDKRLDLLVKKLEVELKGAYLFAPLPPTEDCAICLVPLPHVKFETCYQACCGNIICKACYIENKASIDKQNEKKSAGKKLAFACPFCREPKPSPDEEFAQLQARCLQNDHNALTVMSGVHRNGEYGQPKNDLKALDCYIRAAELGSPESCNNIGTSYNEGNGVSVDKKRASLFERIGALRGSVVARHNIGCFEYMSGNHEIAIRHWKIAAEAGYQDSLTAIRKIYNADGKAPGKEFISKECMDFAYRACHEAQMEVKSEEREKYLVE